MKAAVLNKYDSVLTPDERFRLALAAMARDDEAEVRRLQSTCPRRSYTMRDADFTDRFNGSRDVAVEFMVIWLWSHKQFCEAQWLLTTHARAAQRHRITMTEDDVLELVLRRGAELKATYAGLLRFCAAARLDWRELLQWWPPILDEIEEVRWLLDEELVKETEELTAVVKRLLASVWPVPLDATAGGDTT